MGRMGESGESGDPGDLEDLEDVVALAERVKSNPIVEDVTVDASDDARGKILAGLKSELAAWEADPSRPLHVTRVGRYVVRVSVDGDEADAAGAAVLGRLRRGASDASALADATLALVEDHRHLAGLLKRRVTPIFGAFEALEGGGMKLPARGAEEVSEFLYGTLGGLLEGAGGGRRAPNYIVLEGTSKAIGRIDVVVQRVGKLSPQGARKAAEAALARAVALLAEHGVPWADPVTFPPDTPDPLPDTQGGGPWCVLRAGPPNVLACERCGVEQGLPEEHTADVFQAIVEAFHVDHRSCREGDRERLAAGGR